MKVSTNFLGGYKSAVPAEATGKFAVNTNDLPLCTLDRPLVFQSRGKSLVYFRSILLVQLPL